MKQTPTDATHFSCPKCLACKLARALLDTPSAGYAGNVPLFIHQRQASAQRLCAIWLNKQLRKMTIVLRHQRNDCQGTVYSQMMSVQSKREITSSRMMASDCLLSKHESGRWGKGRSKKQGANCESRIRRFISNALYRITSVWVGKKQKNFKERTWLPIYDPDIIPDKLKPGLNKIIIF